MPCIQLVLAIDVRHSFVIQMEYKRFGLEVMISMLQSLNNEIKLLVVGGVVES